MKNKLAALIAALAILLCAPAYAADTVDSAHELTNSQLDELISGIAAYKASDAEGADLQTWLDGALETSPESADWYAIALRQYGAELDFTAYADALSDFVAEERTEPAATRQRHALALLACGRTEHHYIAQTLAGSIGEQGIMSLVFGLHLLNNGLVTEAYTARTLADELLSLLMNDGGWALRGDTSDTDVTAMTLQALAPFAEEREFADAIDSALSLLSSRQLEDGGFIAYGVSNAESAAQVVIALCSLGIDPENDARFIKNGRSALDAMLSFRLGDGSFAHTSDSGYSSPATYQSLCALVALHRLRSGEKPLYMLDIPDNVTSSADSAEPPESKIPINADVNVAPSDETSSTTTNSAESVADGELASDTGARGDVNIRLVIVISALAAAVIICTLLWLTRKRNAKNFICVLCAAAAIILLAFALDIKSGNSFYGGSDTIDSVGSVTLSIRCDLLVGLTDSEFVPADGAILDAVRFEIADGSSVYDVLVDAARSYSIHMESNGSGYIRGINYIYEFDYGELSGWIYRVNGEIPSVGCGEYKLSDGDVIEWLYTLELGKDLADR